jgi:hypothetical protein
VGQLTRRRLSDLWVTGKEIVFDDGGGDPVTVWMQKLNSIQAQEVGRRADAARARLLVMRNNPDSEEWQAIHGSVIAFSGGDKEPLVEFIANDERPKLFRRNEAMIAAEDRWSKENYLQGLRDSWRDGFEERYIKAQTGDADPEAEGVFAELKVFADALTEAVDADLEDERDRLRHLGYDELCDKMAEKVLILDGNQVWLEEMQRWQVYLATRDPDCKQDRYFVSRAEIDLLSTAAYHRLRNEYENLEVDVAEGKDSPAPTPSSLSFEEQNEAATAVPSGLVGATR